MIFTKIFRKINLLLKCLVMGSGMALLVTSLYAQEIDATYFSISDGLASPNVQEVFQDSYGLLWFGTTNGLQAYDGVHFETFKNIPGKANSLADNNIWSIYEDKDKNLWIGTDAGMSKLDRSTRTISNYDFAEIFNLPPGLSRVFTVFVDSRNTIWASTRGAELVRYHAENDTWVQARYDIPGVSEDDPPVYNISFVITEDRNGDLWTGSFTYGLLRRGKEDDKFVPVDIDPSSNVDFSSDIYHITALYADRSNRIWITTRNGVFRYDPVTTHLTTLITYQENLIDIWNHMNDIVADPDGNIWVLNNFRGILKFEENSDRYTPISVSGVVKVKNIGNTVTFTHGMVDRSGIFWIGSRTNGVLKYDPDKKPFLHYTHNPAEKHSLSMNALFGIKVSQHHPNTIYVGTRGKGLNILDEATQKFTHEGYRPVNDYYGGAVRCIGEGDDGTVFLGTWGDGIIVLDQDWKEKKRYTNQSSQNNSLSDDKIRVMESDDQGNFWVGTNNGLNYFNTTTGTFKRIQSSTSKTYTNAFFQKLDQWIYSDQTIAKISDVMDDQSITRDFEVKESGPFLLVSAGEGDSKSMADFGWLTDRLGDTLFISQDFDETLHAGGAIKNRIQAIQIHLEPGQYQLHYRSDDSHSFDEWNSPPPDKTSFYGIAAIRITSQDAASLDRLEKEKDAGMYISGNNILSIKWTDDFLWIGTSNGLNKVDLTTDSVEVYKMIPGQENTITNNEIFGIDRDRQGMIWLATSGGLNKLNPATGTVTSYGEADGLPTNLLEAVVVGPDDDIWISTQNGLSQMVTNETLGKVTFINYGSGDGLGGDVFLSQVAAVTPEGRFYFGGEHGLNVVSKVKTNDIAPEIIISDLLISNQSVYDMGDDSPLDSGLLQTNRITLSANQNNLSFEFAALHYANPKKNQYAHILKGYDKDWSYDNRNFASYTNLDPGEYEFSVRASNAYGIWNEEGKSLKFTILAPWYMTKWAYTAYALLFALGIFLFDRSMRSRLIRKERERSREKELAQAREIEKAYRELKNTQTQLIHAEKMASLGELTAGIAHEIQNPLNFVKNFAEINSELIDELQEELKKGNRSEAIELARDIQGNENKIAHHGKRADAIVKGMLQHSRGSGSEKEPTDINALCDEYLRLAYHGMRARDKTFNVTIETDFDPSLPLVKVVPQDIGRVVLNLITNAFYACAERSALSGVKVSRSAVAERKSPREHVPLEKISGGPGAHVPLEEDPYQPTVSVITRLSPARTQTGRPGGSARLWRAGEDFIQITVSDNGPGIPPHILDKIFQPFFTTKPTGEGTGLGLSMSYDIVTKGHGGELLVKTKEGEGTTFTIQLPLR